MSKTMRGNTSIDNSADIIDSREVIDRIEYLQSFRDDALEAASTAAAEAAAATGEPFDPEQFAKDWTWTDDNDPDAAEYAALVELQDDAEGYCSDWRHGAALIRRSHFTEYCEQFAEDIGAIDRKAAWPLTHIDWESAARELMQDYTEVTFDGIEYLVRD